MRLEAGAIRYVQWQPCILMSATNDWVYRELHWHNTAEWSYILNGTMQVTTVTSEGQNYIGTLVSTTFECLSPGLLTTYFLL
jgi:hypothetical protein